MLHIHQTVTLRRRRRPQTHIRTHILYMLSHIRMHTHRADNIVSWLYSPLSEAWQRLNSLSCFGWTIIAKQLDSFGWAESRSGWERYFGSIVISWNICLDLCLIYVQMFQDVQLFFQPYHQTETWYWTILQNLRFSSIPTNFNIHAEHLQCGLCHIMVIMIATHSLLCGACCFLVEEEEEGGERSLQVPHVLHSHNNLFFHMSQLTELWLRLG